jgi:hypothetical protein
MHVRGHFRLWNSRYSAQKTKREERHIMTSCIWGYWLMISQLRKITSWQSVERGQLTRSVIDVESSRRGCKGASALLALDAVLSWNAIEKHLLGSNRRNHRHPSISRDDGKGWCYTELNTYKSIYLGATGLDVQVWSVQGSILLYQSLLSSFFILAALEWNRLEDSVVQQQ